jgi:hypothetical protein
VKGILREIEEAILEHEVLSTFEIFQARFNEHKTNLECFEFDEQRCV